MNLAVSLPLWIDFLMIFNMSVAARKIQSWRIAVTLNFFIKFKDKFKITSDSDNKKIPEFYDFMKTEGLSARSQARVISSLRTYFKFCETRGMKCGELRELLSTKN